MVWTGTELIAWGGCDPHVEDECAPTAEGFSFDPATEKWTQLPDAPVAAGHPEGTWTGREALFLDVGAEGPLGGVAFEPRTERWRQVTPAPMPSRWGTVEVWTGSELVVWGGGDRDEPTNTAGAAYDPVSDTWRRIADAPIGLNAASGVWTGREVVVFGSLLNGRNIAETLTSVGVAYDPAADSWRELPPSELSPQATSAVWTGDRVVAWDYEVHSQEYDPIRDRWTEPQEMPLDFSECYPDSVTIGGDVFAFFCGRAALYEPEASTWREIDGGPLEDEVWSDAYERDVEVWRFASMVPTSESVLMAMEGLTLNRNGVACYGCPGADTALWAFTPKRQPG